MVNLVPPTNVKDRPATTLDVTDAKVQKYLDLGWSLAEGETFTPPEDEDAPRELNAPDVTTIEKNRALLFGPPVDLGKGDGEDDGSDADDPDDEFDPPALFDDDGNLIGASDESLGDTGTNASEQELAPADPESYNRTGDIDEEDVLGDDTDDGEVGDDTHLPGIAQKNKEELIQIARNEGVAIDPEDTKPNIKLAIQNHRAGR